MQQENELVLDQNKEHQKRRPWVVIILGAVVAIILAAYLAAIIIIDSDFVEDQVNNRLMEATGGLYFIEIENVDFSLVNRSFQASGISFMLNQETLQQRQDNSELPSVRYEFNMTGFKLDGINLIEFMRADKIKMRSLTIENPQISLIMDADLAEDNGQAQEDEEMSLHMSLARQLPDINVTSLAIINATLDLSVIRDGQPAGHQVRGVNLAIDNIQVDSAAVQNEDRILFSDDVRLEINSYEGNTEDGIYHISTGRITASTQDRYFQIEDIEMTPTVSDEEFVEIMEIRQSRNIFSSESIALQDIDYRRLLDNQDIIIGSIDINTFLFDTFTDLNLPRITPSKVPHELVQEMETYLNIGEINLNGGQITYAEKAKGGYRPGMITLAETSGQIKNITNDIELTTTDNPATITIKTLLNGKGQFDLNMQLPLLAPDLPIIFSGKLGQINAESFNSILVDLEGVNITSGVIDSLMFDIESYDNHATGTVRAAYQDLEIETLGREDYDRSFGNELETIIANNLLLRSSDEDNETPLREGNVDNEMDRMEDSVLSYLVDSLLDGLLSTMVRII